MHLQSWLSSAIASKKWGGWKNGLTYCCFMSRCGPVAEFADWEALNLTQLCFTGLEIVHPRFHNIISIILSLNNLEIHWYSIITLYKPALFSGMTTKLLVKFSACLSWHNKKQLKFLCVSTKKWFSSWEQAARLVLQMPQLADEGAHTCARAPPEVWQSRPASRTQLNAASHAWFSAMVYQRTQHTRFSPVLVWFIDRLR